MYLIFSRQAFVTSMSDAAQFDVLPVLSKLHSQVLSILFSRYLHCACIPVVGTEKSHESPVSGRAVNRESFRKATSE
jgi:hypothetical protein